MHETLTAHKKAKQEFGFRISGRLGVGANRRCEGLPGSDGFMVREESNSRNERQEQGGMLRGRNAIQRNNDLNNKDRHCNKREKLPHWAEN